MSLSKNSYVVDKLKTSVLLSRTIAYSTYFKSPLASSVNYLVPLKSDLEKSYLHQVSSIKTGHMNKTKQFKNQGQWNPSPVNPSVLIRKTNSKTNASTMKRKFTMEIRKSTGARKTGIKSVIYNKICLRNDIYYQPLYSFKKIPRPINVKKSPSTAIALKFKKAINVEKKKPNLTYLQRSLKRFYNDSKVKSKFIWPTIYRYKGSFVKAKTVKPPVEIKPIENKVLIENEQIPMTSPNILNNGVSLKAKSKVNEHVDKLKSLIREKSNINQKITYNVEQKSLEKWPPLYTYKTCRNLDKQVENAQEDVTNLKTQSLEVKEMKRNISKYKNPSKANSNNSMDDVKKFLTQVQNQSFIEKENLKESVEERHSNPTIGGNNNNFLINEKFGKKEELSAKNTVKVNIKETSLENENVDKNEANLKSNAAIKKPINDRDIKKSWHANLSSKKNINLLEYQSNIWQTNRQFSTSTSLLCVFINHHFVNKEILSNGSRIRNIYKYASVQNYEQKLHINNAMVVLFEKCWLKLCNIFVKTRSGTNPAEIRDNCSSNVPQNMFILNKSWPLCYGIVPNKANYKISEEIDTNKKYSTHFTETSRVTEDKELSENATNIGANKSEIMLINKEEKPKTKRTLRLPNGFCPCDRILSKRYKRQATKVKPPIEFERPARRIPKAYEIKNLSLRNSEYDPLYACKCKTNLDTLNSIYIQNKAKSRFMPIRSYSKNCSRKKGKKLSYENNKMNTVDFFIKINNHLIEKLGKNNSHNLKMETFSDQNNIFAKMATKFVQGKKIEPLRVEYFGNFGKEIPDIKKNSQHNRITEFKSTGQSKVLNKADLMTDKINEFKQDGQKVNLNIGNNINKEKCANYILKNISNSSSVKSEIFKNWSFDGQHDFKDNSNNDVVSNLNDGRAPFEQEVSSHSSSNVAESNLESNSAIKELSNPLMFPREIVSQSAGENSDDQGYLRGMKKKRCKLRSLKRSNIYFCPGRAENDKSGMELRLPKLKLNCEKSWYTEDIVFKHRILPKKNS